DTICVFVEAQQMTTVRFQILSLPRIARGLVVEWHLRLVGQHEVTVIEQPGPMLFPARQLSVLDFAAISIEQRVSDQMAGADIRREERMSLIHVERIEVPLHRQLWILSDVVDKFRTGRD